MRMFGWRCRCRYRQTVRVNGALIDIIVRLCGPRDEITKITEQHYYMTDTHENIQY